MPLLTGSSAPYIRVVDKKRVLGHLWHTFWQGYFVTNI